MTEVYCTFDECLFYKPHDEDYGICTKDHITLDETVSEGTCGCPDAEWDEPQKKEIPVVVQMLERKLMDMTERLSSYRNED